MRGRRERETLQFTPEITANVLIVFVSISFYWTWHTKNIKFLENFFFFLVYLWKEIKAKLQLNEVIISTLELLKHFRKSELWLESCSGNASCAGLATAENLVSSCICSPKPHQASQVPVSTSVFWSSVCQWKGQNQCFKVTPKSSMTPALNWAQGPMEPSRSKCVSCFPSMVAEWNLFTLITMVLIDGLGNGLGDIPAKTAHANP